MSPRQAIKAKCKQCIYDPEAGGTFLAQIEACFVQSCPLWDFRPLTLATRNKGKLPAEIPKQFRKSADPGAGMA
jgi:hypothetical protein